MKYRTLDSSKAYQAQKIRHFREQCSQKTETKFPHYVKALLHKCKPLFASPPLITQVKAAPKK